MAFSAALRKKERTESMTNFDLIVIGGGPAGVTAALRGCELGARVALLERSNLGGTCTNDGCAPTRVLAKAARLVRDAEQFSDYGLLARPPEVDFRRLLERTQSVIYAVHEKKQLHNHLESAGVEVFAGVGAARFVDPHTLALGDAFTLSAERVILAAGGRARRLDFPGEELALTHSDVWSLNRLPRSVAVVGGAATGSQLASIFDAFGVETTILDVAPRLVSAEDELVATTLVDAFRRRGIQVITGIAGVERIERTGGGLRLVYRTAEGERPLDAEAVILSTGWLGNLAPLNLLAAGVETERNYVKVDSHLRTTAPHIFAAGDITGRMMLVQSASYEARIAAENALLGPKRVYRHTIVPHGGFTDPEYAGVGLTEAAAQTQGLSPATAVVAYADLDRAVIDGRTEGYCKLVVDPATKHLLGAHVIGEQAVEIVQIVAAGMASSMRVEQLAELEIAYPTFAAILGLAARRIVRDLGLTPVAAEWRTLGERHVAEWERRAV
jgi:dihydrolipoamide dehydrogenase